MPSGFSVLICVGPREVRVLLIDVDGLRDLVVVFF